MKKQLLFLCFPLFFGYSAFSQTTYFVKTDGSDGNSGTSWSQSFATVQKAIGTASSGDKIFVKKGTYLLTTTVTMKEGVKIYGSFAGGEASLSERTIALPIADDAAVATILNGQNAVRVITNDNITPNLTASAVLDGFVIKGGDGYSFFGGGIYNNGNSPTLTNITITGNIARGEYGPGSGGGIYNKNSSPTLTNVTISGNTAGDGGGIFNMNSSPALTNVTISGNTSSGSGYGGGMYNSNSSPSLTNVIISGNAGNGSGGGVLNGNGGTPVFNNVIISNNSSGYGGGVNNLSCDAIFTNVTISGNSAISGGGMVNQSSWPVLTNVTIIGNSAQSGAGGMGNYYYGSPRLTNVTISGNKSGSVGSMYNFYESNPVIRNSIILGNTADDISGISNNSNSIPDIKYSLVQGIAADGTNYILDGNSITAGQVFVSPVAASSAPTATGDYRLLPCSPAINTGTTPSPAVPTDIVGSNRVGVYDLGAYEFQGLGVNGSTVVADQQGLGPVTYSTCTAAIATVTSAATGGVNGSTTAKLWIESTQPAQYVKRHYQIAPTTDGAGRVTLYFTQAEFDDFNAVSTIDLPTGPDDATGKANLRIEKRSGQSSDGTGLPATYTGGVSTIDPVDADIVWNSSLSRWEVSFDVTSFSGFFAKSTNNPLPVTLASFEAKRDENTGTQAAALLTWKTTSEVNSDYFDVERSTDRKNWETIGKVAAMNNSRSIQPYAFRDVTPRSGENLYRLKMVDLDQSFAYSRLRSVIFEIPDEAVVYPNPTSGPVQARVSRRYIGSLVSLIDASGKVLRTFTVATENFPLNMEHPGLYLLRMCDGKTVKVVVR